MLEGNLYDRYLSPACCRSWMPVPSYNGWILGGGLRFDSEEEAEKVPMGFDSKKGFTKMDENRDVANGVWVEVMELKPVIVKEATEK
jgi:hypothetical protein